MEVSTPASCRAFTAADRPVKRTCSLRGPRASPRGMRAGFVFLHDRVPARGLRGRWRASATKSAVVDALRKSTDPRYGSSNRLKTCDADSWFECPMPMPSTPPSGVDVLRRVQNPFQCGHCSSAQREVDGGRHGASGISKGRHAFASMRAKRRNVAIVRRQRQRRSAEFC